MILLLRRKWIWSLLFILPFLFFLYKSLLPFLLFERTDPSPLWEFPVKKHQVNRIKQILDQPFRFLGAGSQCFVFLSEDQNYVIKIGKASRYHSFLPSLQKRKSKKKVSDFTSYSLAFQDLSEETQMLFLHLATSTNLQMQLHLIDPLGLSHFLQADETAFYLQKAAVPLETYMKQTLGQAPDIEKKQFLQSLWSLYKTSLEKGVEVRDIHPKNIGVVEGHPLWIDPGRVRQIIPGKKRCREEKRIERFTCQLEPFLKALDPAYLAFFQDINAKKKTDL